MSFLSGGLAAVEAIGLTDFILPFMLIFTLVFVTLMKAKLFDKKLTRINLTIALSLSLMATRFVSNTISFTSFISKIALIMVILFMFQFILAVINIKITINDSAVYQILLLLTIIIISMHEFGMIMNLVNFFTNLNFVGGIEIMAFIFITTAIVVFVYKIPSKSEKLVPLITEGTYVQSEDDESNENGTNKQATSSNSSKPDGASKTATADEFEEFIKKLRSEGKSQDDPDKHVPRKLVEVDLPKKNKKKKK